MAFLKRRGVSLSAFVRGIVTALCDAQQAMPQARQNHLEHHMEKGDDGLYRPKMINVEVAEGRVISVPTYSLAQVNVIGIRSARVKCDARLVDLSCEKREGTMAHNNECCTFFVNPSLDKRKSIEIDIEFTQRPHAEAEHRLLESLDGLVCEESQTGGEEG